jgi:hypothetical protein
MYWDFVGPTVIADTSSLTTRRPWYSMVYNDAVQGLALSPYGMTDASRYQLQHLAGQKQYELTNHLGNVQATISDLPVKVGEAHTEYHAPALPAVYDYYPFGMLMPDRYTSDTSSECVTVSQTKWVTTWVTHCYLAADWVWPAYSYYGSVSVSTSSGLQIAASESSGIYFEMDVLPYEQQDVYLQTDAFYSGSGTLELQEYHGGQWHMLGSTTFDKIGEVRISIRPREDRIRAVLRGPFYVQVKQFCVQRPQLSQETVLVDICDTDGDKYRFGFNGQEKVNEWAGIGNHNTAEFWEYDTRTGRRYNLDPVDQISISNYAAFANNPITNTDVAGNTPAIALTPEVIGGLIVTAGVLSYMAAKYETTGTLDWSGALRESRRIWEKWNALPKPTYIDPIPVTDATATRKPTIVPVVDARTLPKVRVIPQDRVKEETKRAFYHITYQMNDGKGNVYVGRTSGYGTPTELAEKRASNHHASNRGFLKSSVVPTIAAESLTGSYDTRDFDPAYYFIRGAEDIQIKIYKEEGNSGNAIMGISESNQKKDVYRDTYRANDGSVRDKDNCADCGNTIQSTPKMPN